MEQDIRKVRALLVSSLRSGGRADVVIGSPCCTHQGHWRKLHSAKHSSPFPDQTAAIMVAKKLARKGRDSGRAVEMILRRTDGDCVVQSVDGDECTSSAA